MLQGVKLSKTQSPTTAKDRKRMKVIPYASAIGSIKYAILCTRPIVYPVLSLAREYNSDLGVDHWTAVKIILSGLRNFLNYGGGKRVRRKGLRRCKLNTYPDSSE